MFKGFGVKEEDGDLYIDSNKSFDELKDTRDKGIKAKSTQLTKDGIDHLILVYCRGHGCSFKEELVYMCNSNQKGKIAFQIQKFCQGLVIDTNTGNKQTKARVFAIYDCQRT